MGFRWSPVRIRASRLKKGPALLAPFLRWADRTQTTQLVVLVAFVRIRASRLKKGPALLAPFLRWADRLQSSPLTPFAASGRILTWVPRLKSPVKLAFLPVGPTVFSQRNSLQLIKSADKRSAVKELCTARTCERCCRNPLKCEAMSRHSTPQVGNERRTESRRNEASPDLGGRKRPARLSVLSVPSLIY